jgi:hypothetical protein
MCRQLGFPVVGRKMSESSVYDSSARCTVHTSTSGGLGTQRVTGHSRTLRSRFPHSSKIFTLESRSVIDTSHRRVKVKRYPPDPKCSVAGGENLWQSHNFHVRLRVGPGPTFVPGGKQSWKTHSHSRPLPRLNLVSCISVAIACACTHHTHPVWSPRVDQKIILQVVSVPLGVIGLMGLSHHNH